MDAKSNIGCSDILSVDDHVGIRKTLPPLNGEH